MEIYSGAQGICKKRKKLPGDFRQMFRGPSYEHNFLIFFSPLKFMSIFLNSQIFLIVSETM